MPPGGVHPGAGGMEVGPPLVTGWKHFPEEMLPAEPAISREPGQENFQTNTPPRASSAKCGCLRGGGLLKNGT